MQTPRTFTLTLATLTLATLLLAVGGSCTGQPTFAEVLGISPADDDSVVLPTDDDDATTPAADDDDSTLPPDDDDTTTPPCDQSQDYDCDGVPNGTDVFVTDADRPRVAYHTDTTDWVGGVIFVGYGLGGEHDWSPPGAFTSIVDGVWVAPSIPAGLYRGTIRGWSDGQWADLGCEDVNDPACMYDAGCATIGVPPGYAMAFVIEEDSSRPATSAERDAIPLAEDDCVTPSPQ